MSEQPSTIEINGETYHRQQAPSDKGLEIIAVDNRGLTFVGTPEFKNEEGQAWLIIRNARCVIRWGTSEHIAELAQDGIQEGTKLGRAHDVKVLVANIQYRYQCGEAWNE